MIVVANAFDIFTRNGGAFASRWLHVVVGITWIGLLYYFNVVQVPAFAEMEAAARNNAIDKLASRALWWFRWAALATVLSGLLILGFSDSGTSATGDFTSQLTDMDYFKTFAGISIATGILLALTMFVNVWGIIWRNQKTVIANARNVQAGGEANPDAPAAGRKALLASRQNTIFSFTMLLFMVGTSHFFGASGEAGGERGVYWAVALVIWLLLELNCIGIIGGTGQNITNWMYESHKNALITGGVLVVVYYALFALVLG